MCPAGPLLRGHLDVGLGECLCCFLLGAQLPQWKKKEFVLSSVNNREVLHLQGQELPGGSGIPLCYVLLCAPGFLDSSLPGALAAPGDPLALEGSVRL